MALIECKECSKPISDKAVSCPNCGFKVPKPKSYWPELLFLMAIFLFIAVPVYWTAQVSDPKTQAAIEVLRVCREAQAAVGKILKAPSTATFQDCYEAKFSKVSDENYVFYVDVDAQNSLGATLRETYRVDMRRSTGRWEAAKVGD